MIGMIRKRGFAAEYFDLLRSWLERICWTIRAHFGFDVFKKNRFRVGRVSRRF